MLELLRYMLEGNWKELDKTYKRIEMTHQDQFIGQIMMENDYKEVMESIEKAEQAMSAILQKADENRKEKKKILAQMRLSSSELHYSLQELHQHTVTVRKVLDVDLFLQFERAYEISLTGKTNSFRDTALGYRCSSNIVKLQLHTLITPIDQLSLYLESDIQQIKYLWSLYQKERTETLRRVLSNALANQISFDDEKSLQAYLYSFCTIKKIIERDMN